MPRQRMQPRGVGNITLCGHSRRLAANSRECAARLSGDLVAFIAQGKHLGKHGR